jgi:hypothetical protein
VSGQHGCRGLYRMMMDWQWMMNPIVLFLLRIIESVWSAVKGKDFVSAC